MSTLRCAPHFVASVEALLKNHPLVELDAATAESLTGKKLLTTAEICIVLNRALEKFRQQPQQI